MNIKKLYPAITLFIFLVLPFQAFAQDLTPRVERRQEILQERQEKVEARKAEIQAKRTEKQKQIVERMKEKLSAVVDKMNQMVEKLREHVGKIRTRAAEVAKNRGVDISKVESYLQEAERHIGLAETGIAEVKLKLSELDSADKPKDVAQTFRTGVQSIHVHFKDVRENLVSAVKVLSSLSFPQKRESIQIDSGSSPE
jgi:DNA repair exonuclease SbcCD ATPase subunit